MASPDMNSIRQFVGTNYATGRAVISKLLCGYGNWRQSNGFLKDREIQGFLVRLKKKGEIQVPPFFYD